MSGHSIIGLYVGLRERVLERLRKVNQLTETGSLDAGRHLQKVVNTAREHITQLRSVVLGPMVASDGVLRRAMAHQADHVRQHGARLDQAVSAHAHEVSAVADSARLITAAAQEIERASAAAHALSINARIESSRSGVHVFKAIATELHALSRAIIGANGQIQQLATSMEETLPRLATESQALRAMVAEYTQEARTQIDVVETEIHTLKSAIDETLATSDTTLESIISASYSGLSSLQFQDVCAQSLLQIDQWQADALATAATELAVEVDVGPRLEGVSAEDHILDRSHAGDVMLF